MVSRVKRSENAVILNLFCCRLDITPPRLFFVIREGGWVPAGAGDHDVCTHSGEYVCRAASDPAHAPGAGHDRDFTVQFTLGEFGIWGTCHRIIP
jgi:hypothetical protein